MNEYNRFSNNKNDELFNLIVENENSLEDLDDILDVYNKYSKEYEDLNNIYDISDNDEEFLDSSLEESPEFEQFFLNEIMGW